MEKLKPEKLDTNPRWKIHVKEAPKSVLMNHSSF